MARTSFTACLSLPPLDKTEATLSVPQAKGGVPDQTHRVGQLGRKDLRSAELKNCSRWEPLRPFECLRGSLWSTQQRSQLFQ